MSFEVRKIFKQVAVEIIVAKCSNCSAESEISLRYEIPDQHCPYGWIRVVPNSESELRMLGPRFQDANGFELTKNEVLLFCSWPCVASYSARQSENYAGSVSA